MVHLEKFVCPEISAKAKQAYAGLGNGNENHFELEIKPKDVFCGYLHKKFKQV
jgi:hypothetical protein